MKKSLLLCLLLLSMLSCKNGNKKHTFILKEKLNPNAILIFKKGSYLYYKFSNNSDSVLKVNKLMDSTLKIDSASIFILSKIDVLRKLNKRQEILRLCDFMIRRNELWFYPYYLKGNTNEYLKNNKEAEKSYLKAILILNSQEKLSCQDLNFLILISLVRGDKPSLSLYSYKYKNLNCNSFGNTEEIANHFNKDDFLKNN